LLSTGFAQQPASGASSLSKLVPSSGKIKVAFVITDSAVMIDFAGPWEVFQDVMVPMRGNRMEDMHVFELYTVSDSKQPIRASGGMKIVPDYTFEDAPQPSIVVIPAQMGDSPKMLAWIRKSAGPDSVIMSVCNGVFNLAETGLLKGKSATSHHGAYVRFKHQFPDIQVERGRRWVASTPTIFTAGGLSSGIDLALHVVQLYFGEEVAASTARTMEYESLAWKGEGAAMADYSQMVPHASPADKYSTGVMGNWQGKIASSEGTFTVAVHIWPESDGALIGTIDSVDEDTAGLHLHAVDFSKPALHFTVPSVQGAYEAKLDATESKIEGTWTQHGTSAPLILERVKP
jgi:putative intracellular protease/amidase